MLLRTMVAFVVIARRTLKVSLSYILIIANMTALEKPQGIRDHNCFVLLFEDAGGQKYALKGSGGEITIEVRNCIILLIKGLYIHL